MEEIEVKKITSTINIHRFYCDDCKRLIDSVEESNDGYVPTCNIDYKVGVCVNTGWFRMNKHLCHECAKKQDLKIEEGLLALGFEKE